MARITANQLCNCDGPYESAYSLAVDVCHRPNRQRNQEAALENIARLTHFLQELAPNIKDFEIVGEYIKGNALDNDYKELYKNLLHSLMVRFAKRKLKASSVGIVIFSDIEMRDNIGSSIAPLEFPKRYLFNGFKLIRRCPKIVQVLDLGEMTVTTNIAGLLVSESIPGQQHPVFPEAVPFPNLHRLTLKSSYPFGDNVLFRGNRHSLQFIDITLSDPLATQLVYNHLFSSANNCKNLNTVGIVTLCQYHCVGTSLKLTGDNGKNTRFLASMCPCVDVPIMRLVILQLGSLYSIRAFDIGIIEFSLSTVIKLVKQLLYLTKWSICTNCPIH